MFRSVVPGLLCCGLLLLTGCGSNKHPVKGSVSLDGNPLPGATVIFTSEDGKNTATGLSDDDGNFHLTYQNGPNVPAGTYKVTVTKSAAANKDSAVSVEVGDKNYIEMMSKTMPKGGPGKGSTKPPEPKSEVPTKYTNVTTTTISVQVPSSEPVKIDLRSK